MDIPFRIKDSDAVGVLVHVETFKDESDAIMIRSTYRSDTVLSPGQSLLFVEHDGAPIQLQVSSADGRIKVDLGPDNVSDFAIAFGLQ